MDTTMKVIGWVLIGIFAAFLSSILFAEPAEAQIPDLNRDVEIVAITTATTIGSLQLTGENYGTPTLGLLLDDQLTWVQADVTAFGLTFLANTARATWSQHPKAIYNKHDILRDVTLVASNRLLRLAWNGFIHQQWTLQRIQ